MPPAATEAGNPFVLALDAPRESIEALAKCEALATGRWRTLRVRSLYFDTEDRALTQAGIALRVRQVGDRFVQEAQRRCAPIAGLFVRDEAAVFLPGADPLPTRIADPRLAASLHAACGERPLLPFAEVEVTRSVRSLSHRGARFAVALDVGEARSSAGTVPIARVELALRRGSPEALFALALRLHEAEPALRPVQRDELEAALAGPPTVLRARALEIARGAPHSELRREALAECLRCVTANLAAADQAGAADGVHQLRVAVRRLRGALRLFRNELPGDRVDRLRGALEPLAAALGEVRDLDVFLALLIVIEGAGAAGLDRLRASCGDERARAFENLHALLAAPECGQLFLELGALVFHDGADAASATAPSARDAARSLAAGCDRRALKAGRRFASLSAAELHRLRVRAKTARYAVELLAPLLPAKRADKYVRRATELQGVLGVVSDSRAIGALLERLDTSDSALGRGFVAGWIARGVQQAQSELPRAWRRFRRARRPWD